MPPRRPRKRRVIAVDPIKLATYIDGKSSYRDEATDYGPRRRRRYINGIPMYPEDARPLRRWRAGDYDSVLVSTAQRFLRRYKLSLHDTDLIP